MIDLEMLVEHRVQGEGPAIAFRAQRIRGVAVGGNQS